jgi:hypothetical protein
LTALGEKYIQYQWKQNNSSNLVLSVINSYPSISLDGVEGTQNRALCTMCTSRQKLLADMIWIFYYYYSYSINNLEYHIYEERNDRPGIEEDGDLLYYVLHIYMLNKTIVW